MQHTSTKQRGFTIIEVAIVAPMMVLIALAIVAILITLVSSTIGPNARSILIQQTEKAFDQIESDVNNSVQTDASNNIYGLISTLPANFSDTASTDYSSPPSGTAVLRIRGYDQIANPNDNSGTKIIPAFKGAAPCANTTDLSSSNIVPVVIVYFVKNNALYRRTLTDTSSPVTCGTRLAKTTCSTCSSDDLLLVQADRFTTFAVEYYTGVTNDVITNDPTVAKSVKITITSSVDAGGESVDYSATLRAARLNN